MKYNIVHVLFLGVFISSVQAEIEHHHCPIDGQEHVVFKLDKEEQQEEEVMEHEEGFDDLAEGMLDDIAHEVECVHSEHHDIAWYNKLRIMIRYIKQKLAAWYCMTYKELEDFIEEMRNE